MLENGGSFEQRFMALSGVSEQLSWLSANRLLSVAGILYERGHLPPSLPGLISGLENRKPSVPERQIVEEKRVLEAFAGQSVEALPLKGCLLAYLVYPGPEFRTRLDLDILVESSSTQGAFEVLKDLGYSRYRTVPGGTPAAQETWTTRRDGINYSVDLHWQLRNHPALMNCIGFREQWERAVPLPKIGQGVFGQSPVDALLNASMHWFDEFFAESRPLVWLLDKDLLWRTLDVAERDLLFDLACERGLAGLLAESLKITRQTFGTPIPESYIRELAAIGQSQRPTGMIKAGRSPWNAYWFALMCVPGWANKMERIRKSLFPPPSHMRERYPDGSLFGLPGLYVRRIWKRGR